MSSISSPVMFGAMMSGGTGARAWRARFLLSVTAACMLPACATLPSSGPTARQVSNRAKTSDGALKFDIVPLDSKAVEALNTAQQKRIATARSMLSLDQPAKPVVLGAGDILNIDIYEVGVSLFASRAQTGQTFDPSAHGEKFPNVVVDEQNRIRLPYVGSMSVEGKTPSDLEALINQRLAGKSQSPQAVVTVQKNLSNTVYVLGNANRPGRYELSYGRERLLDAIAGAGGATASAEDTILQVQRGDETIEQRMGAIRPGSPDDVILVPGDRIQLINRPRSFTVFGATSRVSQVSFETGAVSLAEALARVQGPNDNTADPTAIFIFRYDDAIDEARGTRPTIYRVNLMDPASYFLSQRFAMQDKDVIYIANAAANQPSKLVSIINQLFSPFVTARAVTR